MNDKYIIVENSMENAIQEDGVQVFQFRIRIPYYEGVPFSQIEFIRAFVDGREIAPEDLRVVAKTGEVFRMEELSTCLNFFWEYGEGLQIRAMRGGLPRGKHRLDVEAAIRVIYAPKGFGTRAYQEFEIV